MGLENRLRQLESKVKPAYVAQEHHFDFDRWVTSLGLVPAAVRELAASKGSSLIEALCEMLNIDYREFKRAFQARGREMETYNAKAKNVRTGRYRP